MTDIISNACKTLLLALVIAPVSSTSLHAQRAATMFTHADATPVVASMTPVGQRSVPVLVVSGLAFGAVGLYGGALIGDRVARGCESEDCTWPALFSGAGIGMSAMIPLGVHLANHRKGNLLLELLASAALCAGGAAVGFSGAPGALLAIPPAQIASSILIERLTAK
jgi:hypothetical protein